MKACLLILTLGLLSISCNQQSSKEKSLQPVNVVWIIVEDMSPDLGYSGNISISTPFLDSLAKKGKVFNRVFSTGVACSPSRTALATGFYQNYLGAHHMRYPDGLKPALPDSILPVHIRLNKLGYQTANIKTFPGNGKTDWQFDYPENSYDTYDWNGIRPDAPFFARINLRLAHRPFERDSLHPVDPSTISLPPYELEHQISREDWRDYYESIQKLDRQVSGIFQVLKDNNLLKNTVFFFFSDHGRPMTRAKNYLYDSGLMVPLIVYSGDAEVSLRYGLQGQSDELYSLIDVTETTLRLSGNKNIPTQGISLLEEIGRDFVWAAADRIGEVHFKSRMVRTSRFKYIKNHNRDFSVNEATTSYTKANYPTYHLYNRMAEQGLLNGHQLKIVSQMEEEELYDLAVDPYELNNLAKNQEYDATKEEMAQLLDDFSEKIDDKGLIEDDEQIKAAFKKYGTDSWDANKGKIKSLKNKVYSFQE